MAIFSPPVLPATTALHGTVKKAADIGALTDDTGRTPNATIENVPGATAAPVDTNAASLTSTNAAFAACEANICDLAAQINAIRTALRDAGSMA